MKISVITPTYNSGSTIRSTVESILSQSYTDWQHVVVDGGSSDSTLDVVREYERDYAGRLTLVSESDRGIYDAMNKGIALADGDVVGILNSDDFYTRDTVLERIASELMKDDADAVYGDIMYVDASDLGRVVRYYSSSGFRRWKMRLGFMPAHPSFYCRHELYEKFGSFDIDFKIAADFENLLRIIYVGRARTRYIPVNFVTMRLGGASTSGFSSHRAILRDHIRAYRKNGVPSGYLLDLLRYPYKIAELISYRLSLHSNT